MSESSFADRIRERYPEGLTGVFAVGGTRTTYILERNRDSDDPGRIDDFSEHGRYLLRRYWDLCRTYFDLGGQHMIITAFSFRGFYNRGQEYADLVSNELLRFIDDESCAFYQDAGIDPYFAGVEPLLRLPEDHPAHAVGRRLMQFHDEWPYGEGRHKLVWEIASIPLYTFWQTAAAMTPDEHAELEAELAGQDGLEAIYKVLYRRFARAAYGTDIPMPHFYLGTNKSGDLKWRSPMPLSLSGGDYIRMFYTPYPTLFITSETLQAVLEDLAFKERFFSDKTDYSGKFTREMAQAEYARVMDLRSRPDTVLGYSRKVRPARQE